MGVVLSGQDMLKLNEGAAELGGIALIAVQFDPIDGGLTGAFLLCEGCQDLKALDDGFVGLQLDPDMGGFLDHLLVEALERGG